MREAVSRADRRRRMRLAMSLVVRLAPAAAGVGLLVALATRIAGWPLAIPIGVLGTFASGFVIFILHRRRDRDMSDRVAMSVDTDARLGGELRSAHWFATSGTDDEWAAYHVEQAADRVGRIDWNALYPPVRAARAWALTALFAAATLVLSFNVPGLGPKSQGAAAAVANIPAEEVPAEVQRRLQELLAAMEANKLSEADARLKLAELKDLMEKLDPELQKKLAELLDKQPLGKDAQTKRRDLDEEDKAEKAEKGGNTNAGLPEDVRWGLEDLAARLASANLERKTAEGNQAASPETGELGRGSAQAEAQPAGQMSMQLMREAAKDAGQASMMMGGGGMMGGDSQSGAGGNSGQKTGQADVKSIAEALRRELVEAAADARGENVPIEDIRRKTEQGRSTLGFSRVMPLTSFDRGWTAAPPAVPVARHPLLYNYFIRKQ